MNQEDIINFLRVNTGLLEEGNFDELYSRYRQAFYSIGTCTPLTELLIDAGIEPLDYLNTIPDQYAPNCNLITKVVIPENIKSIGDYAFYGCTGLTSVTIGNGVTGIGGYAFSYCMGLTSVIIPNSVVEIGKYAFNDIADIKYEGTKEEWYKIRKRMYWNGGIQKYTIHCTDGDVKGVRR